MYFEVQIMVICNNHESNVLGFRVPNQSQEISSLESVTNQGRDGTRGIQPKFVY